ncbi:multiple sugar transport system permease protein [Thermocatellispora tengchongensis]|uniref:Multiple sugar transport system permease protein n=1 Tax=Thermocatellispora tengchongensis TaxID=1073253 RepID=A0A840PBT8_9ACTN|nr:sugar ABC transporter permease [Thermocatellispora tengchongensis]MBB5133475.1 multiple sugar transport system permease protein [Thermocatellispora tengchongensis]
MTLLTRKPGRVAVAPPAPLRGRRTGERAWALAFASPYLLHLVALTAWPVLASLYFSLTEYNLITSPRFVGLDNFARLFADEVFWRTLGNTAYFAVLFVPAQTILALLLAIALNQRLRAMALFRAAYFVPVVSSWVVVAYVADAVFNPQFGIANQVLGWLGLPAQDWLQDPALVIPTLAAVAVWKGVGYMMVLFLAGLQAIPEDRYEAAKIDGASAWNRFRYITLPGVSGTTFLVLVLTSITTLQSFEQVFVMTNGEPHGASEVTVLYLYRHGFQFFQMGYASAVAWVLFVLVLALTLVQFRLQRRWVHYA